MPRKATANQKALIEFKPMPYCGTLTLTCHLKTSKPCYFSLYCLNTLSHSLLSSALDKQVENAVIDPVTLTCQPETMSLLGYLNVIPYTKFDIFGIIRF